MTYFEQQLKALTKRLALPAKAYTPLVFHRMRVAMKKINALLALLAYHYPDLDQKREFHPFRRLFKQMGQVRDLDVELELLGRY